MLSDVFEQALDEFMENEASNIANGVSERNLCARLAMLLERIANENGLGGYYADPEYNRKQNGQIKTILDDDLHIINITCDLILHSRGDNIARDNLIAIEMKKSERPEEEKQSDRARLRALTKSSYDDVWSNDGTTQPEHVCGYEIGYFLELDVTNKIFTVQRFEGGTLVGRVEGDFGL